MRKLKSLIKNYFADFIFFYRYLGNKIFVAFFLSISVSFLDAAGLTMFFPLIQIVGEQSMVDPEKMGKLGFLVKGFEALGLEMNLVSVLIIMVLFFVLKGIASYIKSVYNIVLMQKFIRDIRLNLVGLLNQMEFKNFILSDVGRIQNTLTGEVTRVQAAIVSYFRTFEYGIMVAVYIGFAFLADAQFAILVTVGGALTNFLYKYIYTRTKEASRKLTGFSSKFQGQIIQHVAHFKYLKATGMVNKYALKLKRTILDIESARRRIGILNSISASAREPIVVSIIALVIFIQFKYFGIEVGAILISLALFYRALGALMALQQSWNAFMQVSGSLENMQDFQKYLEKSKEKKGTVKLDSFEKEIVLDNVDFFYGSEPILKNINLNIKRNQSVAFVGESGSGKTTLVNLISGLLPESKGNVYIDGAPLSKMDKQSYQERIGYVSQDPVVFNDTIFNNVTFWAPKTPENLERFQKSMAQASLDNFLDELPKGMDTKLGNNGINLSGGQKQRVSIARELYKEIDILILDEATSALDSETEKAIQESIDNLQGHYTILSVAHRLSTIKNADLIVYMDKGKILDMDTFDNLVQKQDRFRKMVELQEL